MDAASPSRSSELQGRVLVVAAELGVLGAAWWLLGLDEVLVGAVAALILLSGFLPRGVDSLVSGLGMVGLAGLLYSYYGQERLALLVGIIGVVVAVVAVVRLRRA